MSADNKAIIRRLLRRSMNQTEVEVISQIISPSHALHGPMLRVPPWAPKPISAALSLPCRLFRSALHCRGHHTRTIK